MIENKREAYDFFASLQKRLNSQLPAPDILQAEVLKRWKKPKDEKSEQERVANKENIFSYNFALPEIWNHVLSIDGIDAGSAKKSLRGEYYKKYLSFLSGNTRRSEGHPFGKQYPFENNLEEKLTEIMDRWKKPKGSYAINESYPDLCLTDPFPFKILFEAKYFEGKDLASTEEERLAALVAAEGELVKGVYETAFYRGIPPSFSEDKSEWDYDFGCLLAYDTSDGAYMQQAWDSVASKSMFWDGANIFVMIVRGSASFEPHRRTLAHLLRQGVDGLAMGDVASLLRLSKIN
jgi:hypothetical protein